MRVSEYSLASTHGDWGQVWDSFDRRKKKDVAEIIVAQNDGMDMFEQAGVAAE